MYCLVPPIGHIPGQFPDEAGFQEIADPCDWWQNVKGFGGGSSGGPRRAHSFHCRGLAVQAVYTGSPG